MTTTPGRGDVFAEERQDHIARIVEEHGRARVADLASTFGVSGVTIRKDLAVARAAGPRRPDARRRRRRWAGPAPSGRSTSASGSSAPRRTRSAAPRPAMVVDGESIALDASTTALALARHLKAPRRLAPPDGHHERPADRRRARRASRASRVVMPGGFLRWEALSLVGPLGEGLFEQGQHPEGVHGRGRLRDRGRASATRPRRRRRSSASWSRARARSSASSTTRSGGGPRSRRSAETDRHRRRSSPTRARRRRWSTRSAGPGIEVHLVERTTDRDVGRRRQIRTGGSAPW